MSQSSTTPRLSQEERSKRLLVPTMIAGICGAIPGLVAGPALMTDAVTLSALFTGGMGGAIGGMAFALILVIRIGVENKLQHWWFVPVGLLGGVIGSVVVISIMGYVDGVVGWLLVIRDWLWGDRFVR
ncbi:MAG: hypothetical protein AAF485_10745 [Chloroflexota bacterium]